MNKKIDRLWAVKNKNDEWWSSFVTSPLAIVLNYIVIDFEWITPNRLTFISFVIAVVSVLCIMIGGLKSFILAAVLIQLSHIIDCMDGQMARYRQSMSPVGSFMDKITDQIQVAIWFGAIGYAAYHHSGSVMPLILSFAGVVFYNLRGYIKYVGICTEMVKDKSYLENISKLEKPSQETAGLRFSFMENIHWLIKEQKKILLFDEGVFVFMLSFSLVFNLLRPMLWVFFLSQLSYALLRIWQRYKNLKNNKQEMITK